jgi:hypothetical protein
MEHPVSLRGVYYRVVSAGAVDKTEKGYRLVSRQLIKLRAAGVVPYTWITDGTRLMRKPRSYRDIDQMLANAAASYRRSIWDTQPHEVIVLSEKDAISGTVYPVTAAWDVELGITRGYSSVTFAHSIAETVNDNTIAGKTTFIYQLGDHDPSGVDGWRALQASVREFSPHGEVEFARLAVTPEQIDELELPTRPTKATDSRRVVRRLVRRGRRDRAHRPARHRGDGDQPSRGRLRAARHGGRGGVRAGDPDGDDRLAPVSRLLVQHELDAANDTWFFRLGYGRGYDVGWADGRDAERVEWNRIIAAQAAVFANPRHTELEKRREVTNEPCAARCRTCSRCARYAQAWRNERLYGSKDFSGGPVATW